MSGIFFFKQKTAYEMRISDWSSDVCSSDLDVLLGIAASGTTAYTIAAVERARERGALTIGIANNEGAPLIAAAERRILLDTGPEVVAGSTRLKAGTAQKVLLNLFSTLLMIRLGRVYGSYMVDVDRKSTRLNFSQ